MVDDDVLLDDAAANQVLADNSFEHWRITSAIPHAIRIDDRDRPGLADPKTVGLCAQNASSFGEAELREALFEKRPRRERSLAVAAFRFGLIATEKYMPVRDRYTDVSRGALLPLQRLALVFLALVRAVAHVSHDLLS